MDLKGKVAIVTGTANLSGIGYATAKKFLEYGAEVYMLDIKPDVIEAAEAVALETGGKVGAYTVNVSDPAGMKVILDSIYQKHGKIDVVVSNAAVNIPGDTTETSYEEWDYHMEVNVKSQFIMSKLVVPYMREQGFGSIINMTSANAMVAERHLVAYVTTKGAIRSLTMADGLDNAKYGIRVNCIGPGLVHTGFNDLHHNMVDGGREEVEKRIEEISPIGRAVYAEEIANMALFLASDLSTGCIGAYYPVDGGFSIQ